MSQILQNGREQKNIVKISVLIVSNSFYSGKLKEAIQSIHINKEYSYKLVFVKAESLQDILEFDVKVAVDFIVFLIDTSITVNIIQLKDDLNVLDKQFFIGRICFVNVTNFLRNSGLHGLIALSQQFKIPIINGDLKKPNKCNLVAQRILTLIDANLLKPLPFVPWITR